MAEEASNEEQEDYTDELDTYIEDTEGEDEDDESSNEAKPKRTVKGKTQDPYDAVDEADESEDEDEADESEDESEGGEEGEDEDTEETETQSLKPLSDIEITHRRYVFEQSTKTERAVLQEAQQILSQEINQDQLLAWSQRELEQGKNPVLVMSELTRAIIALENKKAEAARRAEAAYGTLKQKAFAEADTRYRGPKIDEREFAAWVQQNAGLVDAVKARHGEADPQFFLDVADLFNNMRTANSAQKRTKQAQAQAKAAKSKRSATPSNSGKVTAKRKSSDGWDPDEYLRLTRQGR